MEVKKPKLAVMFHVPTGAMRRLTNGDVVFGGHPYHYTQAVLDKQELGWHELGKDNSSVGRRMHQVLLKFGFSPMGGCSCNSIARRMDSNTIEWVEENEEELVDDIYKGVLHYHRRYPWSAIFLQIRNGFALLVCRLIPAKIFPGLIRYLLRKVVRDEKRRIWGANVKDRGSVFGTIRSRVKRTISRVETTA